MRLSFPGQRVLSIKQNIDQLSFFFDLIYLFLIDEPVTYLGDLFVVGSGDDEVAEPLDGGGLHVERPVRHGGRGPQPWRGDGPGHLAAAGSH